MSVAVCFLKGTRIWAPDGERGIEDLRLNDLVVTSSGEAKPTQWAWKRRFERLSGQEWAEEIAPIRVVHPALEPNIPHRDLYLSQYHCLYLDGVFDPCCGSYQRFYHCQSRQHTPERD
jgi:Hint domain